MIFIIIKSVINKKLILSILILSIETWEKNSSIILFVIKLRYGRADNTPTYRYRDQERSSSKAKGSDWLIEGWDQRWHLNLRSNGSWNLWKSRVNSPHSWSSPKFCLVIEKIWYYWNDKFAQSPPFSWFSYGCRHDLPGGRCDMGRNQKGN